ncbi:hypothetical protein EBR78_00365 [bacterium]|nr:hypothetical protein [bacterium]
MVLESCVLTNSETDGEVDFYLHRNHPVLSQFPAPDPKKQNEFEKVRLPSKSFRDIFEQYGSPFYLKLDLEHMDEVILRAVLEADIRPPFISAECHSIEVFALLVVLGQYKSFNLVDGLTVSKKYGSSQIKTTNGIVPYQFLEHSAGPFGLDIQGPWMTAENFFKYLAWEGLGWIDVHATTEIEPDPKAAPVFRDYVKRALKNRLKRWSLGRANA